ncbi:MAG TPA: sulfotransferase [Allosphingosinicella sp.]|jgi:tetratricopeptide (TPR) repeat protein
MTEYSDDDVSFAGAAGLEEVLAHGRRLLDGDPPAAAVQAREILRITPGQDDALRLLAAALRRLGREREAAQADLLLEAAALVKAEELNAAEHLIRPYLDENPNDPAALRLLAEIAAKVGALPAAEELLRKALALAPTFNGARLHLARLLYKQGHMAESLAQLDELLQRDPWNEGALSSKAATLERIGDYDDSLRLYETLLERAPGRPGTWMSYGHLLSTVGRVEDGIAAYRRAVELQPDLGQAWWSLANLKTVRLSDDDIAAMSSALERSSEEGERRLHLHFALGKALEDAGRYEQSFSEYEKGNRIRQAMLGYDPAETTELVRRSKAVLTASFFAERAGWGRPDPDPIFIIGMPRAGSTLIEQILSSHSSVEGTSELPHLPALRRRLAVEHARRGGNPFPDLLADLGTGELRAMGEEYLESARLHRKTGKPLFVDKLPNNWAQIGLIQLILPNAKIIDARRHPMGCCFSNFKQHFAQGQGFTYSLEDVGHYYRDYVELLRHFDEVLPGRIHRVFHEQLVEDVEGEIRRMLDYLGLPFEEACLRFYENDRAVRTPSSEQVRRPINREGVERWKAYEPWLDPLKEALGPVLECYPGVPTNWLG